MLEEAVHVIRELLSGRLISYAGQHYTVETARIYSAPESRPRFFVRFRGEGD